MNELTPAQDALRRSRDAIAAEVATAGAQLRGNACKCPFHDDKSPSAGIYRGKDDGVWRFKCHGCELNLDVFDLRARATGKALGDVLAEARGEPAERKRNLPAFPTLAAVADAYTRGGKVGPLEATYRYGEKMAVLRFGPVAAGERKTFRQIHFNGDGWVQAELPGFHPLYNLPAVTAAQTVIVTEGEKCADAINASGFVATTAAGGAGKARKTDWTPLAGKDVVLWRDNDATGADHMKDVATILEGLVPPPRVRCIDPTDIDLPEKGDAYDYLAPCTTPEQRRMAVSAVLELSTTTGPADEVRDLIEDMIAGRWKALSFPGPYLTKLARALRPGTVTLLSGDPGSGKSLFTLEACWRLHLAGEKVVMFEGEDDRGMHLMRALAQVAECADLTGDEDWFQANPARARAIHDQYCDFQHTFGLCLHCSPDEEPTYAGLLDWIKAKCEAGAGLLVIDPVTSVNSDKPWVEDRSFLLLAKAIIRKHGARLILVTHPKTNTKGVTPLSAIAGGAAFPRFSHTVLWIHKLKSDDEVKVDSAYGPYTCHPNRTIHIAKARNGPGTGTRIAYTLRGDSLRFEEHGPVSKDQKNGMAKASIETKGRNGGPGVPRMIKDPFVDEVP